MTTIQLGERIHVVPSRISALEKAEATGGTTIKSLREAAEAMGCHFVYAIVPAKPMEDMLRARAGELADKELARTNHTMRLENQALNKEDLSAERKRLIDAYLDESTRRLWDAV